MSSREVQREGGEQERERRGREGGRERERMKTGEQREEDVQRSPRLFFLKGAGGPLTAKGSWDRRGQRCKGSQQQHSFWLLHFDAVYIKFSLVSVKGILSLVASPWLPRRGKRSRGRPRRPSRRWQDDII